MKRNGWIRLDRGFFLKWDWYDNSKMVHIFLYLVLSASTGDDQWRGVPVKRGQIATSRRRLVIETGISEMTVKSCLDKLVESKEIKISKVRNYIVITICNYEKYAGSEDKK